MARVPGYQGGAIQRTGPTEARIVPVEQGSGPLAEGLTKAGRAIGNYDQRQRQIEDMRDEADAERLGLEHLEFVSGVRARVRGSRGSAALVAAQEAQTEIEGFNQSLLRQSRSPGTRQRLEAIIQPRSIQEVDRFLDYGNAQYMEDAVATQTAALNREVDFAADIEDVEEARAQVAERLTAGLGRMAKLQGWEGGAEGPQAAEYAEALRTRFHRAAAARIARTHPDGAAAAALYVDRHRSEMTAEAASEMLGQFQPEVDRQLGRARAEQYIAGLAPPSAESVAPPANAALSTEPSEGGAPPVAIRGDAGAPSEGEIEAAVGPRAEPAGGATPAAAAPAAQRFTSPQRAIAWVIADARRRGLRPGQNRQTGDYNPSAHTWAGHGERGLDINAGGGNVESRDPAIRREFDAMALEYQRAGFRVLWRGNIYEAGRNGPTGTIAAANARRAREGKRAIGTHDGHMHVEAPRDIAQRAAGRDAPAAAQEPFDLETVVARLEADRTLTPQQRREGIAHVRERHASWHQEREHEEAEADRALVDWMTENPDYEDVSAVPSEVWAGASSAMRLRLVEGGQSNRDRRRSNERADRAEYRSEQEYAAATNPVLQHFISYTQRDNPRYYMTPEFREEVARRGASPRLLAEIAREQGEMQAIEDNPLAPQYAASSRLWTVGRPLVVAAGIDATPTGGRRTARGGTSNGAVTDEQQARSQRYLRLIHTVENLSAAWSGNVENRGKQPSDAVIRSWWAIALHQGREGVRYYEMTPDQVVANLDPPVRSAIVRQLTADNRGRPPSNRQIADFYNVVYAPFNLNRVARGQ